MKEMPSDIEDRCESIEKAVVDGQLEVTTQLVD
jgi:hypothetical protein